MTAAGGTTTAAVDAGRNDLLAALPPDASERLAVHLQPVALRLGESLYEPGQPMRHATFPTSAVVSLHCVTESGASAEFSGVGREGMVGIALFTGGGTTCSSAVVQTAGHAWRIERAALAREFERAGALQRALLRYAQALMSQVAQTAACYRHHSVEQQLARWLLATLDRAPAQELVMTQELVAHLLGVRRESITQAAGRLQDEGFIRYRRGHISVLDRAGLQHCACECYGAIRAELQRLLSVAPPPAMCGSAQTGRPGAVIVGA